MPQGTCARPGCERPCRTRGLCAACYAYYWKRGTLELHALPPRRANGPAPLIAAAAGQVCTACGVSKPADQYSKRTATTLRRDCKACVNIRNAARRARSPHQRQKERQYRLSRQATIKQYLRDWYQENRDKQIAAARKWADTNRDRYRANMRQSANRRRSRELALPSELYSLDEIIRRDGTSCVLCGNELNFTASFRDRDAVTVEHLECISWPGSAGDVLNNVALAHRGCNTSRGNRPHPRAAAKRAALIAASAAVKESA